MTLTLDLTPAQERTLQSNAKREGVAVEQYILRRVLPPAPPDSQTFAQMQARVAEGFAASGMTEEELEEYAVQSVKQVRSEMQDDGQP